MWFNAATISFLTFAPDFFITRGYEIGFASFLASFLMFGSPILSPMVGYLIDRIGGKEIFIGIGGMALAFIIFLIPGAAGLVTNLFFLMVLMGVVVTFIPVSVFSLPSDILEPQSLGLGFGIISTYLNVGTVVGPYLVGMIRDRTGSYQMGFWLMSAFAIFVAVTAVILKIRRGREKRRLASVTHE